jgi:hypothetical protein
MIYIPSMTMPREAVEQQMKAYENYAVEADGEAVRLEDQARKLRIDAHRCRECAGQYREALAALGSKEHTTHG